MINDAFYADEHPINNLFTELHEKHELTKTVEPGLL
jgi:hypothetical protein